MRRVMLKAGGNLEFIRCTGDRASVSSDAVGYLFEMLEMEEGIRLGDVFQVLRNNPGLLNIYKNVSGRELLEDAFSGEAMPHSSEYDPDGVEYLELRRNCRFDRDARTFQPMHLLDLTAVGFSLKEPLIRDPYAFATGHRQRWSMANAAPSEWMNCPLRFECGTKVWEDYSQRARDKLDFGLPVLGQVIYSILHEFSFFGVGQRRIDLMTEIAMQSHWQEHSDGPRLQ